MSVIPKELQGERVPRDYRGYLCLSREWEEKVAKLDIPVSSRLLDPEDKREWGDYIDCLSPEQQLRKLGQALDQFHGLIEKTADPRTLSEEDQISLYSKWKAARIVSDKVADRFRFPIADAKRESFKSEMTLGLSYLINFLKSVRSPDTQMWEDRSARHDKINNDFYSFLGSSLHGYDFVVNKNSTPTTSRGPAA